MKISASFIIYFFSTTVGMQTHCFSQWSLNIAVNNAISTATDKQELPQIVSDGSGGAIIVWQDWRTPFTADIYAQRITVAGVVQWATNGVAICTSANGQERPQLVADGSGGAIIAWQDARGSDYDVYAQKINSSGVVQWTADGVVVSAATNHQTYPEITSDGSGGAIIAWTDFRSSTTEDIYAQRIDAFGSVIWTADGVAICTATQNQTFPKLVPDGSGGAILAWLDYRAGGIPDIYAQRINAGTVQWAANGLGICMATNFQENPRIISDGGTGAIITWSDFRSGSSYDIYVQKINSSGSVQWTADGLALCTLAEHQREPQLVSDGSGGAIVAWHDYRSGTTFDIYAQGINSSGTVQWTANGVPISATARNQEYPAIAQDGSGGAVITWHDERVSANFHIYAQRINGGTVQWTANGVAVSTATDGQFNPKIVTSAGCATIIVWDDQRAGFASADIYAQALNCSGTPLPVEWLSFNVSEVENHSVKCEWTTASEINNNYFAIERSMDGICFEQIGTIKGAGNSTYRLDYTFNDADPFWGLSYYRLRQVDYDGQFDYSGIRTMHLDGLHTITIFPNPCSNFLQYTLTSKAEKKLNITLLDVLGRVVFSQSEVFEAGDVSKRIDTSNLCNGNYFLRINAGGKIIQKQFVNE